MKRCLLLLSILWLSWSSLRAASTPTITAVTVTTDTSYGALVTFTMTGHGPKANAQAAVVAIADEGINPISWGRNTTWTVNDYISIVTTDTAFGSQTTVYKGELDTPHPSSSFRIDLTPGTTWFRYTVRKYSFSFAELPGQGNLKRERYWPSSGLNDFVCSAQAGGICLNENNTNQPGRSSGIGMDQWTKNVFAREQALWAHGNDLTDCGPSQDCGSINGDGTYMFYENNTRRVSMANILNGPRTQEQLRSPDNYCSECVASGGAVWLDLIFIDDSWSRIMISSSPTLAGATDIEPLAPMTWPGGGATGKVISKGRTGTQYGFACDYQNWCTPTGTQITVSAAVASTYSPSYLPIRR